MSADVDQDAPGLERSRFTFGRSAFYFARHGETFESRNGIVQGQTDTKLTDTGRLSAEALGLKLARRELASIYSSPLQRAWATASIVARVTGAPIRALPGLMERHWGRYQGTLKAARPQAPNPSTVETLDAFSSRVIAALRSIDGPAPVLVVAHSGVFRVIAQHIEHRAAATATIASAQLLAIEPVGSSHADWRISDVPA